MPFAPTKLHKNIGLCAVSLRFLLAKSQKYRTFAHIEMDCASSLPSWFRILAQ